MHVNTHYRLIKRAIHRVLGDIGKYNPGRSESLQNEYGMDETLKRALYLPINEEYSDNDTPITPELTPSDTGGKDTVYALKEMIKDKVSIILFIGVLLPVFLFQPLDAFAKKGPHIQDDVYNKDDDPEIVTFEERNLYFSHTTKIDISKIDENGDGKIDSTELPKLNKMIRDHVEDLTAGLSSSVDDTDDEINTEPLTLDFVLNKLDAVRKEPAPDLTPEQLAEQQRREAEEKKRLYTQSWVPYLRREGTDVSIRASKLSKNPASFSYKYNGETGNASGRIQAAFGLLNQQRRKRAPGENKPYVSAFTYGGSIAIDRSFDPRGASFEKNSLIFRGGGDLEVAKLFFPTQYLTSWFFLDTDTDFEKQIAGFEATYQPVSFANEAGYLVGDKLLRVSFAPTLETKYGNVIDPGSKALAYDEYWNVGPAAQLVFRIFGNNRMMASLSTKYTYFWDVTGKNDDTYIWDNTFKIPVFKEGVNEISIVSEYKLSKDGLTGAKTNEFTTGLGWLF